MRKKVVAFVVPWLCCLACSSDHEPSTTGVAGGASVGATAGATSNGSGSGGGPATGSGANVSGAASGVGVAGSNANGGASSGDNGGVGGAAASSAGSNATGGAAGGTSGAAGAANGAGGGVAWADTGYASRKWARWAIPNPPSLNLPHPMSYTDGATISDRVTGLVWQKSTNAATTTWQAALDYCTGLGAGWSLPTRIELTSIVDNTLAGAKSDPLFKYGSKAGWTWASTPWVVNSRKVVDPPLSWFINTSAGDSNNSLSQLDASAYARCVLVPASQTLPAAHYSVDAGVVTDNYTGLDWQQDHSGSSPTLTQSDAAAYCQALSLSGGSWRLPSLNELASIVDDVPTGNVSPAVDHVAFPTTSKDQWYWSASRYGTSSAELWQLSFLDGFTAHKPSATLGIARCVR